jgi:hypothetical protein
MSPVKYELGFFIQEDDILHSHRRENLKSYIIVTCLFASGLVLDRDTVRRRLIGSCVAGGPSITTVIFLNIRMDILTITILNINIFLNIYLLFKTTFRRLDCLLQVEPDHRAQQIKSSLRSKTFKHYNFLLVVIVLTVIFINCICVVIHYV